MPEKTNNEADAQNIDVEDIEARVKEAAEKSGKSEKEVLDEMFGDGFLTIMIEETGTAKIDVGQIFLKEDKKKNKLAECIRLRDNFGPVASCVSYIRDQLLGGAITAVIDDPKDKNQTKRKEEILELIDFIHQDQYTRGLYILLGILIDNALTTGCAAAEICYQKKDLDFWQYATVNAEKKVVMIKGKEQEYVDVTTSEPDWSKLGGIVRLKIATNAHKRFNFYRDPLTWQGKYWTVDEKPKKKDYAETSQGFRLSLKTFYNKEKAAKNVTYFHPWQIFWLVLNRRGYDVKGISIVQPILSASLLLEKILNSVGEGIYRAGNKKYFIVCGTEKRPWSKRYIRNLLKHLQEASTKNWSTIPVPSGFSIEEMGGEVFEAQNTVAYFKRVIARGMGVPVKVLGVELREEPEYTFELMRKELISAIKHQLFEKHLWCKHGKTKLKQSGRSSSATYIPDPKMKFQSALSPEQILDLYIKTLNPANPIRPQLKLELEKELAKLFGWDDIAFPTQEEYEKELKAMEEKTMKLKEKFLPKGEKAQGPPKPQTEERQKERLKGMAKEGKGKRGEAKEMGGSRIPKEIQETEQKVAFQPLEIRIVQESKPESKTLSPTDKIIMELAEERKALTQKQKQKEDLETRLTEEKGKKAKEKIQKEIDNVDSEIEKKKIEVEKLKVEIEKVKTETKEIIKTEAERREEIKKTEEKKREAIEKATQQIEKEENFMGQNEEGDA